MKRIRIYCDICGEEMKKDYGLAHASLRLFGQAGKDKPGMSRISLEDICCRCVIELFDCVDRLQGAGKNATGD